MNAQFWVTGMDVGLRVRPVLAGRRVSCSLRALYAGMLKIDFLVDDPLLLPRATCVKRPVGQCDERGLGVSNELALPDTPNRGSWVTCTKIRSPAGVGGISFHNYPASPAPPRSVCGLPLVPAVPESN